MALTMEPLELQKFGTEIIKIPTHHAWNIVYKSTTANSNGEEHEGYVK
jgi:hypothetical protein